ncbi:MAG: ribonuclease T [Gammaproteobacteria bacterium]|nr:ribonuclease T [Gammaproteobacteria bacterium]
MRKIKKIFNGFLPVVLDCEMSGVNPAQNALLEIAAFHLDLDQNQLVVGPAFHQHVIGFEGAMYNEKAMKVNGIIPDHPLRFAIEERVMMEKFQDFLHQRIREVGAKRAILVGHNIHFDLNFLLACQERTGIELPIHHFCVIDTATLGVLMFHETVLSKILKKAKIDFDQAQAHGALYDAQKTAEVACYIFNHFLENKAKD